MKEEFEFLDTEEIETITGRKLPSKQIEWLKKNGWYFELNAANKPVVGRFYARQRFAGITPKAQPSTHWQLDLANIS